MSPLQVCPSPETLSDYLVGKLSDEEADSVTSHLKVCDACVARMDECDDSLDSMVQKLKHPGTDDAFMREPECQQAVLASGPLAGEQVDSGLGQIRDYQLVRKLGEGGMGTVYEAIHTRLDQSVAIKVLPQERMESVESVRRFHREMRAVGKLDHPHIVRAQDAGEVDGKHYLVMELVKGIDLSALVHRLGSLPVADACELIRQAAIGLQHVHEHGFIHRDIKPSNLMVTPEGNVKVLDLGLARLHEDARESKELTFEGQVMGTLDYMAPEQLGDSHTVGIRADIYGLGATLFKLLTGEAPYAGQEYATPTKKLVAIATKPAPPIADFRSDTPPGLIAVLDRMLAKNPDERYSQPSEVAESLEGLTNGSELSVLVAEAIPLNDPRVAEASPSTLPHVGSALADTKPTPAVPYSKRSSQVAPLIPRFNHPAAITAAACFLFVVVLAVYYVTTNNGTLVVKVDDSQIDVILKQHGIVVHDLKNDQEYTIREPGRSEFSAGEYRLIVADDSGLEIETEEFALRRGGEKVVSIRIRPNRPANTLPPNDHSTPGDWLAYGLVGHWTFDGDDQNVANDVSGNGNHGRFFGGDQQRPMTRSSDVPPVPTNNRSSLLLVGKRERLVVPHNQSLNIDGPLTLAAWVKIDNTDQGSVEIVRKNSVSDLNGQRSYINGYCLAAWHIGVLRLHYSNLHRTTPTPDRLDDRQWHHVAGRWNGGTWTVFVDGRVDASGEWYAPIPANEEPLLIGNDQHGHGIVRLIDDVRVYRRALSDEDIEALATGVQSGSAVLAAEAATSGTTEPLCAATLVTSPARIDGVKSWSIESVVDRYGWGGARQPIAISPDSQHLAAASADGVLRIYSLSDGELVAAWAGNGARLQLQSVDWSPNGNTIAVADVSREVRIWEYPSGRVVSTFEAPGNYCALAWSPSGETLAVGGEGLTYWNSDGAHEQPLTDYESISSLEFSPDGSRLAIGDLDAIHILKTDGLASQRVIEMQRAGLIRALSWSPDGRQLASASADGKGRIWDVASGIELETFESLRKVSANGLSWSPDSTRLAACGPDLLLYDLKTEETSWDDVILPGTRYPGIAVGWSKDGKSLVSLTVPGRICVFDLPAQSLRFQIEQGQVSGWAGPTAWSPDGRVLLWAVQDGRTEWEYHTLKSWNLSGGLGWTVSTRTTVGQGKLWSPDGQLVASLGANNVEVFENGQVLRDLPLDKRVAMAWGPDSRLLALRDSRTVDLWDLRTGRITRTIDIADGDAAPVAWAPSKWLAVADHDGSSIDVYDLESYDKPITTLHGASIGMMAFSPDGQRLVSTGETSTQVWEIPSGRLFRTLPDLAGVLALAWSDDGSVLRTDHRDGRIRSWALDGNWLSAHVDLQTPMIRGTSSFFSPNGRFLAKGGPGSTRWLYSVENGVSLGAVVALRDGRIMQISPNGHYMSSADVTEEIVYIAELESGSRVTFSQHEFESRFNWKNDASKAQISVN